MGQEQSYYVGDVKKTKTTKQTKKQAKISGQSKRISQVQGSQYIQPKPPPSESVQVKQAEETSSGKTEDSKSDESGKAAAAQVEVHEESPHVQQTTQVQTITVPRPEEEPSKHLRTAKQYKEWADRTAFFFPPKK